MTSTLIAACYSAACRPPTSGGSGGSLPRGSAGNVPPATRAAMGAAIVHVGGKTVTVSGRPKVVRAEDSPHYQKRGDMTPLTESEWADMATWHAKTNRIVKVGRMPSDGEYVTVRANLELIPVVQSRTGKRIIIQTLHESTSADHDRLHTGKPGPVINYGRAFVLRDATMRVNQGARAQIASGGAKFPMAGADGKFVAKPNTSTMFDGVELRFNPKTTHLFVDPDGRPVKRVGEATIVGDRVYARGDIEYYDASDYPQPRGGLPTAVELAARLLTAA